MCPLLFLKKARLQNPVCCRLMISSFIVTLPCIFTATVQAQRPSQPLRDMVRAIERKEMDRLLLLKPLIAAKDDPGQRAVLKQISEDFRDMQGLNNKMMAEAWAREELDYRYISDMVSQIRSKATRLKSNLSLPQSEASEKQLTKTEISNSKEFRAGLLHLDRLIMSFVTNPLFQKSNVVEVDLANRASYDLGCVIEQTSRLKKTATKLNKSPKTSQ